MATQMGALRTLAHHRMGFRGAVARRPTEAETEREARFTRGGAPAASERTSGAISTRTG